MASLVVSVIRCFDCPPFAPGRRPGEHGNAISHYGQEATPPEAWDDDKERCLAASRQSVTAVSRAAGLNGFCRLETAPSLVAMVRKSGAVSPSSENTGRPEITMIGISGRIW